MRTHGTDMDSLLPGTAPLVAEGDFAAQMVDGIRRFLLMETQRQASVRAQMWNRDYSSPQRYVQSVAPNRESFRKTIGAVDQRVEPQGFEVLANIEGPDEVAQEPGYRIYAIRWRIFVPVTADASELWAT